MSILIVLLQTGGCPGISGGRRFSEFYSSVGESSLDTFPELSSNFSVYLELVPVAKLRQVLGVSRWKALMGFRVRSTTRLPLSRLVSVSICLCAFAFLPLPQLAVMTWAESAPGECPCQEGKCPRQEDGKRSEEELVVWSSSRLRLKDLRHNDLRRLHKTGDRPHQIASCAGGLPARAGHQLANGLCAPLLI